jgi:hypothetical protein
MVNIPINILILYWLSPLLCSQAHEYPLTGFVLYTKNWSCRISLSFSINCIDYFVHFRFATFMLLAICVYDIDFQLILCFFYVCFFATFNLEAQGHLSRFSMPPVL